MHILLKNIESIIDDTEENISTKIKNFNLIVIPYQIIIGKKAEGDLIEFNEIGGKAKKIKIAEAIQIINNKKK